MKGPSVRGVSSLRPARAAVAVAVDETAAVHPVSAKLSQVELAWLDAEVAARNATAGYQWGRRGHTRSSVLSGLVHAAMDAAGKKKAKSRKGPARG